MGGSVACGHSLEADEEAETEDGADKEDDKEERMERGAG